MKRWCARRRRHARRVSASPVVGLVPFRILANLPFRVRRVLGAVLSELRADAAARASKSWAARKGPMAAYWRHVAAHAGLVRRAIGLRTGTCVAAPASATDRDKRNPILALPSAVLFAELNHADRRALADALGALHSAAGDVADLAWQTDPDAAAYWRAASVYAGHVLRAVNRGLARDRRTDLPRSAGSTLWQRTPAPRASGGRRRRQS